MLACEPAARPPIDLANVEADTGDDVDLARSVCAACPALVKCREWALRNDVAGVCGGLTGAEREAWRERRGFRLEPVLLADVVPARQLTRAELESLPEPVWHTLPPAVRGLILRMTEAGMPAEEIVDRLDRSDVTFRTVNYVRRSYRRRDRTYIEAS